MRGLDTVELEVMRLAHLPYTTDLPLLHYSKAVQLEKRGLLRLDSDRYYWPTKTGTLVFKACTEGVPP